MCCGDVVHDHAWNLKVSARHVNREMLVGWGPLYGYRYTCADVALDKVVNSIDIFAGDVCPVDSHDDITTFETGLVSGSAGDRGRNNDLFCGRVLLDVNTDATGVAA